MHVHEFISVVEPVGADLISLIFRFFDKIFKREENMEDDGPIEQYVYNVLDFSSQYGSEISVSYTASNLRGPPSNFPDYGDYHQAFVMRTYGTWWDEAPSAQKDFMSQNNYAIPSQDFVEVSFEKPVYPLEVSVFETYHPGAVVRIWAWVSNDEYDINGSWILLWEGEPQNIGDTPRIFTPLIKKINAATRILRLEFNHRLLPYYTELDAVLLKGQPVIKNKPKSTSLYKSLFFNKTPPLIDKGLILQQVLASNLTAIDYTLNKELNKDNEDIGPPLGYFQNLPDETILCILKYLDLQSLCRCAQVNTHFNRLASDSILYRSIDLKPYWHCVNSKALLAMSERCKLLQKLDLSWCGSRDKLSYIHVSQFIAAHNAELTHLRLNCCVFVNNYLLTTISAVTNLQELCLRSIFTKCSNWKCLSALTKLKRLDLYRTNIFSTAAIAIIMSNPGLQHLNLGSCKSISSMDDVAIALGGNCPDLISVDFWKSYSLTPNGIQALGRCMYLQELDLGWCLQAGNSGEWLSSLHGCHLRKLFLGALRGVSDRDLRGLLPRAPRLAQLDLLGVRAVTPDIINDILNWCRELKLLDVSFCHHIKEEQVLEWREKYPHVSIKWSFQTPHLGTEPNNLPLAQNLE